MRNKEGEHSLIGFIAFCQSRSSLLLLTQRGILRRPASVLAPGSALGSLPSVALSSAQVVPIIVGQQRLCRKIGHAIGRADGRSWPINDPGEIFSPRGCRIPNYTTKNTLASPAGKGVKTSRPGRRFVWPVLKWPHMAGFDVATEGNATTDPIGRFALSR